MVQVRGAFTEIARLEKPESAYGTDPGSVHSIFLPIEGWSVEATRTLITPQTFQGTRSPGKPGQGFVNVAGPVTVPVDYTAIGYWLQMLMGTPTSTRVGSDSYQHVFSPSSVLDSFAFEMTHQDQNLYSKYTGMKVGGMTLSVGGDETLSATFDLVGKNHATVASLGFPGAKPLVLNRFHNLDAGLTENTSVITTARNLELSLSNELDENVYTINSLHDGARKALPEGFFLATGRFDAMFENWSFYAAATSGTARSLQLKLSDATGSYYLQFHMDELIYEKRAPIIDTPGGLWVPMAFHGYYDVGSSSAVCEVKLINSYAVYSGHVASGG